MTQLESLFEKFRREELPLDELSLQIDLLIKSGVEVSEVLSRLDEAFRRNELPNPFYQALRARLLEIDAPTSMALDTGMRLSGAVAAVPTGEGRETDFKYTVNAAEDASEGPTRLGSSIGVYAVPRTLAGRSAQPGQVNSSESLKVGDILKDRFVLEEVIGRGGMGVVFKALDLRRREANDKDPYVAVKVLTQDFRENPLSFISLQRECKRAQTLSHPNIINVYDFDRDGPYVFMSMEYLRGTPLNKLIQKLPEGGMPFRRALAFILGIGEALGHAHKKGIVHSDFKPGNVFVDEQGEIKVLDFGIACAVGRHDQTDATVFNARELGGLTPAYASLEMLQGVDPDPRDDIYALACVTYELLTGRHPYGRLSADRALELGLQPKPIPGIKRKQWRALQKALALRREDRTATAGEFIDGLQVQSSAYYGAWTLGIVVLVVFGSNFFMLMRQRTDSIKPEIVISQEQAAKIKDLLELAEIHIEVGYLTAPTGSNALWAYREVLKIDPYNDAAAMGIKKIADNLEQKAWEFYEQGDRAESLKAINDGLEALPNHPGLLKLKSKLEQ